jgi:O-antigen ligase
MGLLTLIIVVRHLDYNFSFSGINDAVRPFFRNHVTYSALLVFMVPLQIAFLQTSTNKKLKRVLLACLVITVAALYLSYARGAWIALLGGAVAYWLLKKQLLFKSFIAVVLLAVIGVFWLKNNDRYLAFAHDYKTTIFHQDFEEHLAATYQMKDLSTAERFYRWIAGVRMAQDSWQTGFGPSTFYEHYKSYTVPAFKTWVSKNEERSTVHNYFLLLLAEQGAAGLLLFLSLLGAMFWKVQKIYSSTGSAFWKNVACAIGAILVMQCILNSLSDLIETDKVGSIFYLCVAVLVIADRATRMRNTN